MAESIGTGIPEGITTVNCNLVEEAEGKQKKNVQGNQEAKTVAVQVLEEIQQYRAIGTPEECRAAVEKQTAKESCLI